MSRTGTSKLNRLTSKPSLTKLCISDILRLCAGQLNNNSLPVVDAQQRIGWDGLGLACQPPGMVHQSLKLIVGPGGPAHGYGNLSIPGPKRSRVFAG
jgi:hypothetical protein